MILPTLLPEDALGAMLSWSFSTALAGMSACWLIIRLSLSDLDNYLSLSVDPCY